MTKKGILHSLRLWIYVKRQNLFREKLKRNILEFTASPEGKEFQAEGAFISKHGLAVIPYPFQLEYNKNNINLEFSEGYPYVNYKGKNLFLSNSLSPDKAKAYANDIILEQDDRSPHRYQTPLFTIDQDDIILDIGCGDANFSLEHIDRVKKAFLFDNDPKWVIPVAKTFQNWKDKVAFFNKRVGFDPESVDPSKIQELDSQSLMIKIDVDGAERQVLQVVDALIPKLKSIKVAICTYHQNQDAADFEQWFKSRGFQTRLGEGYMLFHPDNKIKKPYFRPGVLFAYREQGSKCVQPQ